MRILAIDTSQPNGHVAVAAGPGAVRIAAIQRPSSHLVELGRSVERLLAETGIRARDIDRVALVSGPGSFTGLRIGMAYAKGLHAAIGMDIVVITSLELLAVQASEDAHPVSPMIDARKNEVYAALYARRKTDGRTMNGSPAATPLVAVIPARAASPDEYLASLDLRPTVFVGSGALRYRGAIEARFGSRAHLAADDNHVPSVRVLCELAPSRDPLTPDETKVFEPFYVRSSGAVLKPLRKLSRDD